MPGNTVLVGITDPMFQSLIKLVYYGTIAVAVILFVGLLLIESAALWHWLH